MIKKIKNYFVQDAKNGGKVFSLLYSGIIISLLAFVAYLIPFHFLKDISDQEQLSSDSEESEVRKEGLAAFGKFIKDKGVDEDLTSIVGELVDEDLVDSVKNTITTVVDEDKVRESFEQLRDISRRDR